MKKTIFVCDRCGSDIKDEGCMIIPMHFEIDSGDMTVPVVREQEDCHYCMDCTKHILEVLKPLKTSDENVGVRNKDNSGSELDRKEQDNAE